MIHVVFAVGTVAVTSLPGLVLTVTAAARGEAELAVANALGGVAAQTFFIAIADVVYRRGTLSNGVPTRQVTFQASFLLVMLSLIVLALGSADRSWIGVHPITPVIVVVYGVLLTAVSTSTSPVLARSSNRPPIRPSCSSGCFGVAALVVGV